MTQTASRPAPTRPRPAQPPDDATVLPAAVAAGTGAAVLGLLAVTGVVLALWVGEDRSRGGVVGALRTAGDLWLLAHGARLDVAGVHLGLAPLGLTLLAALLCRRAGRRAAQAAPGCSPRAAAVGITVPYVGVAVVVAALADGRGVSTPVLTAAVGAGVVAVVGALAGLLLGRAEAPSPVSRALAVVPVRLGVCAVGVVLGLASVLTALSLALHGGTATSLASATEPGAVGGLGLLLLGAALAPNAVVCGASLIVGPGFAVGGGTAVTPGAVHVGAVPGVPLLAALPHGPLPGVLAALVPVVPVLVGAAAGWQLHRLDPPATWTALCRSAATCAGTAAGVLLVLSLLAGGPVGSARLSAVGPSPWRVALAGGVEVLLGCGVALAAARWRAVRAGAAAA